MSVQCPVNPTLSLYEPVQSFTETNEVKPSLASNHTRGNLSMLMAPAL